MITHELVQAACHRPALMVEGGGVLDAENGEKRYSTPVEELELA
jgi:hypothetical protein